MIVSTVTLPSAITCKGRTYVIKRGGAGSGDVTIDAFGSEQIGGSNTLTLDADWEYVVMQSARTIWIIIGGNI